MSTVKNDTPPIEELTTDTGGEPVPGHDAWFRERVEEALEDERLGRATYTDLRAVAAKYGFDAR